MFTFSIGLKPFISLKPPINSIHSFDNPVNFVFNAADVFYFLGNLDTFPRAFLSFLSNSLKSKKAKKMSWMEKG